MRASRASHGVILSTAKDIFICYDAGKILRRAAPQNDILILDDWSIPQ